MTYTYQFSELRTLGIAFPEGFRGIGSLDLGGVGLSVRVMGGGSHFVTLMEIIPHMRHRFEEVQIGCVSFLFSSDESLLILV